MPLQQCVVGSANRKYCEMSRKIKLLCECYQPKEEEKGQQREGDKKRVWEWGIQ